MSGGGGVGGGKFSYKDVLVCPPYVTTDGHTVGLRGKRKDNRTGKHRMGRLCTSAGLCLDSLMDCIVQCTQEKLDPLLQIHSKTPTPGFPFRLLLF